MVGFFLIGNVFPLTELSAMPWMARPIPDKGNHNEKPGGGCMLKGRRRSPALVLATRTLAIRAGAVSGPQGAAAACS
jgi:hypothetical protein